MHTESVLFASVHKPPYPPSNHIVENKYLLKKKQCAIMLEHQVQIVCMLLLYAICWPFQFYSRPLLQTFMAAPHLQAYSNHNICIHRCWKTTSGVFKSRLWVVLKVIQIRHTTSDYGKGWGSSTEVLSWESVSLSASICSRLITSGIVFSSYRQCQQGGGCYFKCTQPHNEI